MGGGWLSQPHPFFSGSFNSSMVHSQLSGNWLREMMSSSGMMSSSRSPGKAGSQLSLEQARFSCCSLDTRLYRPGGAPSTETPPWPCDDFGGPGHVCLSGLLPPQKHEKNPILLLCWYKGKNHPGWVMSISPALVFKEMKAFCEPVMGSMSLA